MLAAAILLWLSTLHIIGQYYMKLFNLNNSDLAKAKKVGACALVNTLTPLTPIQLSPIH